MLARTVHQHEVHAETTARAAFSGPKRKTWATARASHRARPRPSILRARAAAALRCSRALCMRARKPHARERGRDVRSAHDELEHKLAALQRCSASQGLAKSLLAEDMAHGTS